MSILAIVQVNSHLFKNCGKKSDYPHSLVNFSCFFFINSVFLTIMMISVIPVRQKIYGDKRGN